MAWYRFWAETDRDKLEESYKFVPDGMLNDTEEGNTALVEGLVNDWVEDLEDIMCLVCQDSGFVEIYLPPIKEIERKIDNLERSLRANQSMLVKLKNDLKNAKEKF